MEELLLLRLPPSLLARASALADGAGGCSLEPCGDAESFWLRLGVSSGDAGAAPSRYPCKLVTLPTLIEVHKAAGGGADGGTGGSGGDGASGSTAAAGARGALYKSGEVTRALVVIDPTAIRAALASAAAGEEGRERATAAGRLLSTLALAEADPSSVPASSLLPLVPDPTPGAGTAAGEDGGGLLLAHGLSAPTAHIVRRRFARAQRFLSRFSRDEVAAAERVLLELARGDRAELVVEELVDAEEWMAPFFSAGGDNVTIEYEDGILRDMYQMQPAAGVGKVWSRGAAAGHDEDRGVLVRPSADGTFPGAVYVQPGAPGAAGVAGTAAALRRSKAGDARETLRKQKLSASKPAASAAAADGEAFAGEDLDFLQLLGEADDGGADGGVGSADGGVDVAGGLLPGLDGDSDDDLSVAAAAAVPVAGDGAAAAAAGDDDVAAGAPPPSILSDDMLASAGLFFSPPPLSGDASPAADKRPVDTARAAVAAEPRMDVDGEEAQVLAAAVAASAAAGDAAPAPALPVHEPAPPPALVESVRVVAARKALADATEAAAVAEKRYASALPALKRRWEPDVAAKRSALAAATAALAAALDQT